jgi:hypothetical protein
MDCFFLISQIDVESCGFFVFEALCKRFFFVGLYHDAAFVELAYHLRLKITLCRCRKKGMMPIGTICGPFNKQVHH